MKLRVLAISATAALALGAGQALAQYPPPAGNIVTTVSNPNPAIGGESAFTVTVQSEAGVPAANVNCTASIASQPGSDATVVPSTFTTDSLGKADLTLKTGSTPGQVTVAMKCGELSATTVVSVGSGAPLPPDTGLGATANENGGGIDLTWAVAGVTGLFLVAGGAVAYRRSRSS